MHRRSTRTLLLSSVAAGRREGLPLALSREWRAEADALAVGVERLADAVNELQRSPGPETVRACQLAWEAARLPWERAEGFLPGDLQEAGWTERIDGWPILPAEVEAHWRDHRAGRRGTRTAGNVLPDGPRGFHVLELLLYTTEGDRPAAAEAVAGRLAKDPERVSLLAAAAAGLGEDCRRLRREVLVPGVRATTATGASSLPGHLLEQWLELLEDACFAKVLLPVQREDPRLLESRWSGTTHRDVESNLEGMARAGRLLVPAVAGRDYPESAGRWEAAMARCLQAARSLPALSGEGLDRARSEAESLFAAGRGLSQLIAGELLPHLRGAT